MMIHKLCEDVSKRGKFVLYGAGNLAQKILQELSVMDCQPLYCVVTNSNHNMSQVSGISVYSLEEKALELQSENVLVVVSVTEAYTKEIVQILKNQKIENVIAVSDYLFTQFDRKSFEAIYQDKEFEWFIPRVEKWHKKRFGIELNYASYDQSICENENQIIFVTNCLSARVVKIAKALKKKNKEVVILLDEITRNPVCQKFYRALEIENIRCIYYDCFEELLFLLGAMKSKVIHIFSYIGIPYMSWLLVRHQDNIGKVVFENYDIANGFYTGFDEDTLKLERYCLENAMGVSYREFSLEFLTDIMHFNIKGKTIRFFDYCSNQYTRDLQAHDPNELHLCYAGGLITEEEYPDCPWASLLAMGELCEKNKCHLHIYPHTWDEKEFHQYIERDKESVYFHFHRPVPYDRLASEISKYDYGITPTSDWVWEKDISGYNTKDKYIYAATNKFFDYLDAGLPVISGIPLMFMKFLEEKGVAIIWTNGQYDFEFLRRNRDAYKKRVPKVQEALQIQKHIHDLIKFYDEL